MVVVVGAGGVAWGVIKRKKSTSVTVPRHTEAALAAEVALVMWD